MRRLNVLTVCGFGIGSSLILKMTVDSVFEKHGIDAEVEPQDVTSVADNGYDIVLTSDGLYPQIKEKISTPIIIIENFISEPEIEEKVLPLAKELAAK